MKKLLLVSTALVGVAMMSAPASAAVKLDLGGFFRGYGVFADNNEVTGTATSLYNFEFRRDTEVHANGETTLDNGLTVGMHAEMKIGNAANNAANNVLADEIYGYASGGWGRVNLGVEDGAAFLLQVAAPSADSNIDGLRAFVQGINATVSQQGPAGLFANSTAFNNTALDYDHGDFRQADRLTYLTPKFNGFQGGLSYAPKTDITSPAAGMALDNNGLGLVTAGVGVTAADYSDLWEVSARWDGEFQGLGVSLGAGYSTADNEISATTAQVLALTGTNLTAGTTDYYLDDGIDTYNVGANFAFRGFSLGGGYTVSKTERIAETVDATTTGKGDISRETWVAGLGYDNGPYHVGASYLNQQTDYDAVGTGLAQAIAATAFESHKYTVGGGYTFGPGMTFRGAVAWGEFDSPGVGAAFDNDFTQVTVGTNVQF